MNEYKKLIGDLHSHTIVSGHAYGTIRENAQAAADIGLEILGITEHGPGIPGTCDPFYFCNLKAIPRELYGVKIMIGCEINVLNEGKLSLDQRWIDRLDYGIAGIHLLCYKDCGKEGNTENLLSCMKNEKIKIVSHPDDDHTPLDYEKIAIAAKEYGVALEVNNSSLLKPDHRINCFENYKTMLEWCEKTGTMIVIDSDAHDPSAVGRTDKAFELVKQYNFPEEQILNNDLHKILRFMGKE